MDTFIIEKNSRQLKNSKNKAVFLNLHKSLMKVFKGIENLVEDNIYTIKYLTEFEGNEESKDKENSNKEKDEEENKMEEENE